MATRSIVSTSISRATTRWCSSTSERHADVIPAQRLRRCRWRCEPCGALAPLGEPRRMNTARGPSFETPAFDGLLRMTRARLLDSCDHALFRAFSSEVDTGSREENASKQEVEPRSDSIG